MAKWRRSVRGCVFRERCSLAAGRERCVEERPLLAPVTAGHLAACHFSSEMEERNKEADKARAT
jgi:hypothetical protein